MKAAIYTSKGSAKQVLQVIEREDPEPIGDEVRVKVAFSGVNPSDVKTRARPGMDFPEVIPHSDGAGTVDAVGPQAPQGLLNRRVWIYNGQWQRPRGTAAGYVCLPASQVVPLPDAVSFEIGASLGIPLMTAYHAVQACGSLVGKTVLVPFNREAVPMVDLETGHVGINRLAAGLGEDEGDERGGDGFDPGQRPRGPKDAGGNR